MFGRTFHRLIMLLSLGALSGVAFAAAPPAEQPVPDANQAMVRFLHAAPNAEVERIVLTSAEENIEPQEFSGLTYGEMSEYVPIQAAGYEVAVALAGVQSGDDEAAAGAETDVPTVALDPFGGEYYTIALIGVVPPSEEAQENEGFFAWLENLFTGDDEDQYTFRTLIISDGTTAAVMQDEAEIRIAHLAPGTDAVDLVAVRSDGEVGVLHTVGYAEVSGFARIIPAEASLQLRAAGSDAVLFDLTDANLTNGRGHTIFVTGTPVEQVPLDVIVVPNPQIAINTPGVGAVPPGSATFDATQMAMMRDSLIALEERLMAIGDRLANLQGVEGAQDEVAAAQEELNEAMELLMAAREQVEAQPAQQPVPPAEPAGDADGG
ncbi:MAG TPA: hypothetical protein VFF10_06380 [Trueperaceae bacterium]|nr:hypothetical protein [Trueperaceae bacterium]